MIRVVLAILLLPSALWAHEFQPDTYPVLGNVVNVASDDVLNIRLDPDHQSEILGTLAFDASNIEIVGEDETGLWGLVNSFEASGWVRLSFIDVPEQPRWHEFQTPLTCFGTEPFWDLHLNVGATEAIYEDFDGAATSYDRNWMTGIAARLPNTIGLGAGDLNSGFSAVIENQMCHDGMSDRENALRIRLFIHEDGASYGLDGCCGLSP